MSATLTQFTITGQATGYWRATFSNPPINLIDPDTILELQQLIGPDFLPRWLSGWRLGPERAGSEPSASASCTRTRQRPARLRRAVLPGPGERG